MGRIIEKRTRRLETATFLVFENPEVAGAGWQFPCAAGGNVDETELKPAALENLQRCRETPEIAATRGVRTYRRWVTEYAVLQCDCNRHVLLQGFTNSCKCGREYNQAGQRLADRAQWGEETGETF